MMTEIKSFWIDDRPELEDIEHAFELAKTGIAVSIRWYIRYNGSHERIITKETTQNYSVEEYFKNCILHTYAV